MKHTVEMYDRAIQTLLGALEHTEGKTPEEISALRKHVKSSLTQKRLDAMLTLARGWMAKPAAAFDADPWLFNVQNGTIDLRTGALRPHSREDYITMVAPVAYQPDATCPAWEKFLAEVLPDVAVRSWVQKFLGYSMTGLVTEQILTFFHGGGANGKSTLLGVVQHLLGEYATQGSPGLLLQNERGEDIGRRQRARLLKKRLVVCQEVEAGKSLDETGVKQLTGGDKITAARLYENEIEFEPTHKVVVAANHKPSVRNQDHGIWRRLRLVPFEVTVQPEHRDPRLPEKLRKELPGILLWLLKGCQAWQSEGLDPPEAILLATASYKEDEDRLGEFLELHTEKAPDGYAAASDLHARYREWCNSRGERPWSLKALSTALRERGFGRGKSGKQRYGFTGLRLKVSHESAPF